MALIKHAAKLGRNPSELGKWSVRELCSFLRSSPPEGTHFLHAIKAAPTSSRVQYAKRAKAAITKALKSPVFSNCGIINNRKSSKSPFWAKRRIGTSSINGEAHLVVSKDSFSPPITFVMKVMPDYFGNKALDVRAADKEYRLCRRFGKWVEENACPHFLMTYGLLKCDSECQYVNVELKQRRASKTCRYMLNELASGDLRSWVMEAPHMRTVDDMGSMFMQVFLGVGMMHAAGYTHEDLHWGNVLYHEMPRETIGKYWWYKVGGEDVYILNTGQLWVLWDFGEAQKHVGGVDVEDQIPDLYRLGGIPSWVDIATLERGQRRRTMSKEVNRMIQWMDDLMQNMYNDDQINGRMVLGFTYVIKLARLGKHRFVRRWAPAHDVINAAKPYMIGIV